MQTFQRVLDLLHSAQLGTTGMWKIAVDLAKTSEDPWEEFNMGALALENVIVHRFSGDAKALRSAAGDLEPETFASSPGLVKIEATPFAAGAQRECYRLKLLAVGADDAGELDSSLWDSASTNFVAKRYMERDESGSDRTALIADVRLQSAAVVWAQSFNNDVNPPKKVDMLTAFLVEFPERVNSPLFVAEAHMAGGFVKYNTNAGFTEGVHWSNDLVVGSTALMQRSSLGRGRSASSTTRELSDASPGSPKSPSAWLPVRILRQKSDGTYDVHAFSEECGEAAPTTPSTNWWPATAAAKVADVAAAAPQAVAAAAAVQPKALARQTTTSQVAHALNRKVFAQGVKSLITLVAAQSCDAANVAVETEGISVAIRAAAVVQDGEMATVWKLRGCSVGQLGSKFCVVFFPVNLHAGERRCVHILAERLGLAHRSFGVDPTRRIVIAPAAAAAEMNAACDAADTAIGSGAFAPLTDGSWETHHSAVADEADLARLGLLYENVLREQLKKAGKTLSKAFSGTREYASSGANVSNGASSGAAAAAVAPRVLQRQKSSEDLPMASSHPRATPQAFSMYSWLASGGRTMVVDVQGVGDLYTDPQLHSVGSQFGDSDLGIRGMALFHASHEHSALEHALGLTKFPLYCDKTIDPKRSRGRSVGGRDFIAAAQAVGSSMLASAHDKLQRTPDARGTPMRPATRKTIVRKGTMVATPSPPTPPSLPILAPLAVALARTQTTVSELRASSGDAPRLIGLEPSFVALTKAAGAVHFALAQLHQEAMNEGGIPDSHRRNPHIAAEPNAIFFHAALAAGT